MNRTVLRALFSAIAAVFLGHAAPASAQPADAPSAQELYTSAQALFDQGRYAEALVLFRQAFDASQSPNARLMVGNCLVALGRTAEAYEEMAATLREVEQRAGSDPKYAPTRDAAATQLALLEPKVGKIVVNLEGQHARITMNGVEVPKERLGAPVAVLPGAVVIVATAPDGRSSQKAQDVAAGETAHVTIAIEEAPRPSTQVEQAIPDPPPDSPKVTPSGGGVRTAGFVVAGLGVAGLAVFGVAGSMARGKFSTLEEECGGTRCTDPKYGDVVDSGKTLATVANVGLIAGIAGLVGGGAMIAFGGPSAAPSSAAWIAPSPRGMVIAYAGSF